VEAKDMNVTQRVIAACGGQAYVAGQLGVTKTTVFNWCQANKVPAEYAKPISLMSAGMATPAMLRPDLWGE